MPCLSPIIWTGSSLKLLDQRLLPKHEEYLELYTSSAVANAITDMVVRGAPAIGIAGAYGVVLAVSEGVQVAGDWCLELKSKLDELINARPTAVNLEWAVERMKQVSASTQGELLTKLISEADSILQEEIQANLEMSRYGAELIENGSSVITHCNTGTLATSGVGTALGVIKHAWAEGKLKSVYADETRPWLQGARLTMWEFKQENIPAKLICEGAAASVFANHGVDWVIVGADRITANGDAINKIGTYALAIVAKHHGAKVMVVAPESTVDMSMASGQEVVIEERASDEVTGVLGGDSHTPEGILVHNPAFDVTPAALIDAVVTENGVKKF